MLQHSSDVSSNIWNFYERHNKAEPKTQPPFSELKTVFATELQTLGKTFLVLDAMDESPSTAESLVSELLPLACEPRRLLAIAATSRNPPLNILATREDLELFPISSAEDDIGSFVRLRIHQKDNLRRLVANKPDLEQEIIAGVVSKASNM
jgi:hypothetical protein